MTSISIKMPPPHVSSRRDKTTSFVPELIGRVLVVDDNARARQSIVDVLKAAGHEVVASPSAIEALKIVERNPFDVIVTDLQMPGMDGLAFIRTLAERRVESQIVMITAF